MDAEKIWRVPIFLVSTSGKGERVGELLIDIKTGIVVEHTSLEELRSKGLALAEKIARSAPEANASAREFIDAIAPPPQFLREAWEESKRKGLDRLSMKAIDAEISAARSQRRKKKTR